MTRSVLLWVSPFAHCVCSLSAAAGWRSKLLWFPWGCMKESEIYGWFAVMSCDSWWFINVKLFFYPQKRWDDVVDFTNSSLMDFAFDSDCGDSTASSPPFQVTPKRKRAGHQGSYQYLGEMQSYHEHLSPACADWHEEHVSKSLTKCESAERRTACRQSAASINSETRPPRTRQAALGRILSRTGFPEWFVIIHTSHYA